MQIGILGTGVVGQTLGSALIAKGHEVMMGSRDRNNSKAAEWTAKNGNNASAGTFAEAAAFGGILFNCTKGEFAMQALELISG